MKTIILAGTLMLLVAGCNDKVPHVDDPRNIVVSGQPMTPRSFVDKYCAGETDNENCVKVRRAMAADSTKSKNGIARF
jgi:hypothetical protein